ncbi:MAG: C39 family peptidase [Candidatus Paceibacterota bacterium]|jgi:ABC-type bacteriocin/lantibiotic exporter with double-glycine peptidase domain
MTNKTLLDVKAFQETLHSDMCGPASLKMVLSYYGIDKSEQELSKLVGTVKGIGVGEEDLVRVASSFGLKAIVKDESNFSDINSWLAEKVPVIVNWFTRGRQEYPLSEMADGHYSVVVGLDKDMIYLQDPEIGGLREINRNDFLRVWFDFRGEYMKDDELILRQIIAIYK